MKNFSLKHFIVVILLAFLWSCSSKNSNQVAYDENGNPIQNVDTDTDETTSDFDDQSADNAEETPTKTENTQTQNQVSDEELANIEKQNQEAEKALKQEKKEQAKKAALAKKAVLKKYNIDKNIFNILETYTIGTELLNKDNNPVTEVVLDEEGNVISESGSSIERIEPLVMSNFNKKDNLQQYITKYFPDYKIVARATFSNKELLSISNIKSYGAYIDSSLIVLKIYFENSLGLYLYDIYYLNGDITSEKSYWYRNGSEAIALEQTLEKLKITDLNSYDNIITPVAQNTLTKQANTPSTTAPAAATKTPSAQPTQENDANKPNPNNAAVITDDNAPNDIQNTEGKSDEEIQNQNNAEATPSTATDSLGGLSLYEAQEKLLSYRVEKVIGVWRNLLTDQLVVIRELPQNNPPLPNNNKRYGIYILLDKEINDLKINSSLNWLNDDLMGEFNILDGEGFYLNREKMLSSATIRLHPAKKLMMIHQNDGNVQYYIPVLAEDLDEKLKEDLYGFIIENNKNVKYDNSSILIQEKKISKDIKGYNTFFTGWAYPAVGIVLFALIVSI